MTPSETLISAIEAKDPTREQRCLRRSLGLAPSERQLELIELADEGALRLSDCTPLLFDAIQRAREGAA